jgi:hypothetical protein
VAVTSLPINAVASGGGFTYLVRMSWGTTRTNCKHAVGLVAGSLTAATDAATDPDTTLGASGQHLIIHRHAAAGYGAGGLAAAAGDVVARWYDSTAADEMITLIPSASVSSSFATIEFSRAPGATAINAYVDGVLKGSFTGNTSAMNMRDTYQVVTDGAFARLLNVDTFMLEYQMTLAR